MNNPDAALQYLCWALVPLCREVHPDCKAVMIKVDLVNGQTITSYEPKPAEQSATTPGA